MKLTGISTFLNLMNAEHNEFELHVIPVKDNTLVHFTSMDCICKPKKIMTEGNFVLFVHDPIGP